MANGRLMMMENQWHMPGYDSRCPYGQGWKHVCFLVFISNTRLYLMTTRSVITVETLYSTIYYDKYFIELNIDKSTQNVAIWTHKRHSIPRASYGVSFMSTSTEIDRAIKGFYCTTKCKFIAFHEIDVNIIIFVRYYFIVMPTHNQWCVPHFSAFGSIRVAVCLVILYLSVSCIHSLCINNSITFHTKKTVLGLGYYDWNPNEVFTLEHAVICSMHFVYCLDFAYCQI